MKNLIITEAERKRLEKLVWNEVVVCQDIPKDSTETLLRYRGDIFLKGKLISLVFGKYPNDLILIKIRGLYYPYKQEDVREYEAWMIGDDRPRVPRFVVAVFFEGKKIIRGNVWRIRS